MPRPHARRAPVARAADKKAPGAPKRLSATLALTKTGVKTARVTLRWVKPTARDLDHVIVVLNLAHAPKNPTDGTLMYSGLGDRPSCACARAAPATSRRSPTTRATTSPNRRASASRLPRRLRCPAQGHRGGRRPAPDLESEEGQRVLQRADFPQRPAGAHRLAVARVVQGPEGQASSGTYVWFVWPAVKSGGASPKFADLIGRSTFVVKA